MDDGNLCISLTHCTTAHEISYVYKMGQVKSWFRVACVENDGLGGDETIRHTSKRTIEKCNVCSNTTGGTVYNRTL